MASSAENPLRIARSVKLRSKRPVLSTAAATGTNATSSKAAAPNRPVSTLPECLRNSAITLGRTRVARSMLVTLSATAVM